MKTIELTSKSTVENLLPTVTGEDILVMRGGHAVALVTPFDDEDVDWYARERDPEFLASIQHSRGQVTRGETISFEELESLLVENVDGLNLKGFSPPVSVETLQRTGCKTAPEKPGVYVVMRPSRDTPVFLTKSVGGKHRGEDKTYPMDIVRSKWIEEASVVYVGMTKADSLRNRLKSYMDFGLGKSSGHRGGRLIWQLKIHRQLFVRWKTDLAEVPDRVEKQMLRSFRAERGSLPFANFR